ncbi:hypothetical protein TNCV_1618621 [Trichonephila clavipes]|nr:hypothetical protein TNCV_1618621 [Trichonephila clavipes]
MISPDHLRRMRRPWAARRAAPQPSMSSRVLLCKTKRGLLATDLFILSHGQVARTTPEMTPFSPNYHTTPTGGRLSSRQI